MSSTVAVMYGFSASKIPAAVCRKIPKQQTLLHRPFSDFFSKSNASKLHGDKSGL